MDKLISLIVLTVALSGCMPPRHVEGEIISSKESDTGITEHLVKTDSPLIPYYILRSNKNNLQKGAKIVIEVEESSMIHLVK
jgi:hypothetical protein